MTQPGPPPVDTPIGPPERMHPVWKQWFINMGKNIGAGGASGVGQIIAGTNVTIAPPGGTGAVTINSAGPVGLVPATLRI